MNSEDLLSRALVRAGRCEPALRVGAMLRIARVQTAFDRGQARVTLEMALGELARLKGRERDGLLLDARLVASVVAPELLPEIPSSGLS